jgi:PAS domain S-box-containing protein
MPEKISLEQLQKKVKKLESEAVARRRVEKGLRKNYDALQKRVAQRTAELVQANAQLTHGIEEAKRAGKALKVSEEKYRCLYYYDPNPLLVVDEGSGEILEANDAAALAFQYDRETLLQVPFWKLFDADDSKALSEELKGLADDGYLFRARVMARRKDGSSHFFANIHVRRGRFRVLDDGGFGDALIIRVDDITEQLEREAQLIQASKMATLGEMATGVAHELNQPLNVMQVGADFLSKSIKRGKDITDEELSKVSRNIGEQVERAVRIINHLREFGRKSDVEFLPVDLNEPIRNVFTLLGQQLKVRNIGVTCDLDDNLPNILADKYRLEQVFLNLIVNARDAIEEKGPRGAREITIATFSEGETVVATVSDAGKGIPPQIRDTKGLEAA